MERRFQQKERDLKNRMDEEFQAREEELRWKMQEEHEESKKDDEVKDQMKDLRGASEDLRRQLTTMMELQSQMMMKMTKEDEKQKRKVEAFSIGEDDEEEAQETFRWSGGTPVTEAGIWSARQCKTGWRK